MYSPRGSFVTGAGAGAGAGATRAAAAGRRRDAVRLAVRAERAEDVARLKQRVRSPRATRRFLSHWNTECSSWPSKDRSPSRFKASTKTDSLYNKGSTVSFSEAPLNLLHALVLSSPGV